MKNIKHRQLPLAQYKTHWAALESRIRSKIYVGQEIEKRFNGYLEKILWIGLLSIVETELRIKVNEK